MTHPTLYSFRRCPYAIRTRLALVYASQQVALREVVLRDKPSAMLAISPKGTVPVLQLPDGAVIDESLDIMLWALRLNDPLQLLASKGCLDDMLSLINENDNEFKHWLDRYKYSVSYPEHSAEYYRQKAEIFLRKLEQRLKVNTYLFGPHPSLADIAIMPFVRQFAFVDKAWFDAADYPALQSWLTAWLETPEFTQVMQKYAPWQEGDADIIFNSKEGQVPNT